MLKKLTALIGAGALLAALVVPVVAVEIETEVEDNTAKKISNEAVAVATSGENTQGGFVSVSGKKADVDGSIKVLGDNDMTTGKARAKATASLYVNSLVGCGACGSGEVEVEGNSAKKIRNSAKAIAESGENAQGGSVLLEKGDVVGSIKVKGDNTLTTKSARATSRAFMVVNSIWSH